MYHVYIALQILFGNIKTSGWLNNYGNSRALFKYAQYKVHTSSIKEILSYLIERLAFSTYFLVSFLFVHDQLP